MNWNASNADVQHSIEHVNDHPLTPIKTPQSAKFGSDIFFTPTLESNFTDQFTSWDTLRSHAWDTEEYSRGYRITQGTDAGVRKAWTHINSNTQGFPHEGHLDTHLHLDPPSVGPAHRSAASPEHPISFNIQTCLGAGYSNRETARHHMQTPPPTRSAERPPNQEFSINMPDGRKISTPGSMPPPETPNRGVEASPHLFPTLQFSPDLFQYPGTGPLTAPVIPQHRLFWDSNDDSAALFSGDAFHSSVTPDINSFMDSPSTSRTLQPQSGPSLQHPLDFHSISSPFIGTSSPQYHGSVFPAPFTASPRVAHNNPEDPGMFLSSPARRFGPTPKLTTLPSSQRQIDREAYHHQIQESRREQQERAQKSRTRKDLAPSTLKPPQQPETALPTVQPRPGIRRSNTHSGISAQVLQARRQQQSSFAESANRAIPRAGRSSPLKRTLEDPSSGIERPASRNRISLALTVDEDGRARTVPRPVIDTIMDDGSSEGSNSSFAQDDFDIAKSRNVSFTFPAPEPNGTRAGIGLLRAPDRSHSKSSSYSSTLDSSNSADPSSRTSSIRDGNVQAIGPNSFRRMEDEIHRTNSPLKGGPGDAQEALRAMIRERGKTFNQLPGSRSHPNLQQLAFHSSPPIHNVGYDFFANPNVSPTTITDPDLATPSTDRGSQASGSTRCICSSSDQVGRFMIQCESCSKWLHMKCVGLDPNRVPPVYICTYCSQTPMRHGRLREPHRANALSAASPLAHKSNRRR